MDERYSRQTVFNGIGKGGQEILRNARAAIVGVGALGTVSANLLARAGVGYLRLIDRDIVDISNLQRQVLYTESDAGLQLPKAVAAAEHLRTVNSGIEIEPHVCEVNSSNAERLLDGVDIVLDGTDNLSVRYLVNEVCVKLGIPWVYGGALGSNGAVFAVVPGGACFRCLFPDAQSTGENCAVNGVLNTLTSIVGSLQVTETIKILLGKPTSGLMTFDVWNGSFVLIEIERSDDCPVCVHGEYDVLNAPPQEEVTVLCRPDSFQVTTNREVMLSEVAGRLDGIGAVGYNEYRLSFINNEVSFTLFPDGRALIRNVSSEERAKSIYTEYIGL